MDDDDDDGVISPARAIGLDVRDRNDKKTTKKTSILIDDPDPGRATYLSALPLVE